MAVGLAGVSCAAGSAGRSSRRTRRARSAPRLPRRPGATAEVAGTGVDTPHPLDQLGAEEVRAAAALVRAELGDDLRFQALGLKEPSKASLATFEGGGAAPAREAAATVVFPGTGRAKELVVDLAAGKVAGVEDVPVDKQPIFSPDDCFLAEAIVKADDGVRELLKSRYGIEDVDGIVCDPWSVHVASADFPALAWRDDGVPPRLVQTFLYARDDPEDNQYAHPIDILPVVDLNAGKVVQIDGLDRPAPKIPSASVNYHRAKLKSNTYLQQAWRADLPAALNISQPDGPSFSVDGSSVTWQKWSLRVGFNYREGLVLHDVRYDGRPVLNRGSLVEMAVPYGDSNPPFERKCAFDVGDYGLGYCTDSLELGCDCLGHIHYFDAVLADSKGEPYEVKKAICMHEEDNGLLWKHVEYRTGHSEARRSRRLVLSFIATVVNYEYLFYWYLIQDGSIEFEIKLSGELSTNLLSEGEEAPEYGVMVAPGVNAQVHQHMFCARLDVAVDGVLNTVSEVDVEPLPPGPSNPFGNAFAPRATTLKTELGAVRDYALGRAWKVSNATGETNPLNGKPTAYKLLPFTRGPAFPPLLTADDSAVSKRGVFATKALWVTPHADDERYPAGDYTVQSSGGDGLPDWTAADRPVEAADVVLWHSFGVVHVPRAEDFPVMPCESTGFTLKPDNFFAGNPSIDLPPDTNKASSCCSHDD